MNKQALTVVFSLSSLLLTACNDNNDEVVLDSPITFDFSKEHHQFKEYFSDYPKGEEEFFELIAKHELLPESTKQEKGWWLHGNNHSDDLLMGIKGSVSGLTAQSLYRVSMEVEFLTNAPSFCGGIGGAPGESVFVKLATSQVEPMNNLEDGYYRPNIDIGFQSQSGTEGAVVGDVANGIDCNNDFDGTFVEKTLSTEQSIDVLSSDEGKIWVMAATDSGFEGLTQIYITKLTVTISK